MNDPHLTIMIVEDEILIAMELELLLEEMGHTVVGIAACAADAIALAARERPALALVDIHLTDGPSGISICQQLAPANVTRVVFMSGNSNRIPEDCAGAVGCIGKPYTHTGVKSAMKYLCKGLLDPPPVAPRPTSLALSPTYAKVWA